MMIKARNTPMKERLWINRVALELVFHLSIRTLVLWLPRILPARCHCWNAVTLEPLVTWSRRVSRKWSQLRRDLRPRCSSSLVSVPFALVDRSIFCTSAFRRKSGRFVYQDVIGGKKRPKLMHDHFAWTSSEIEGAKKMCEAYSDFPRCCVKEIFRRCVPPYQPRHWHSLHDYWCLQRERGVNLVHSAGHGDCVFPFSSEQRRSFARGVCGCSTRYQSCKLSYQRDVTCAFGHLGRFFRVEVKSFASELSAFADTDAQLHEEHVLQCERTEIATCAEPAICSLECSHPGNVLFEVPKSFS